MARKYFFPHNTVDLNTKDLEIMNRAGRLVADMTGCNPPQFILLSKIRTMYRPGMSAQELCDEVMAK